MTEVLGSGVKAAENPRFSFDSEGKLVYGGDLNDIKAENARLILDKSRERGIQLGKDLHDRIMSVLAENVPGMPTVPEIDCVVLSGIAIQSLDGFDDVDNFEGIEHFFIKVDGQKLTIFVKNDFLNFSSQIAEKIFILSVKYSLFFETGLKDIVFGLVDEKKRARIVKDIFKEMGMNDGE